MKQLLLIVISILSLTSCGINSNIMFKETKNSNIVVTDSIPLKPSEEYKLSANDKFVFNISTNDGQRLIDLATGTTQEVLKTGKQLEYIINVDGRSELPKIGFVDLAGLTVNMAQDTLEKKYGKDFNTPFVKLTVTNKRVIVFPGSGSDAKVVPLTNNNTTLMEALAIAGGIAERGKANKVKLMRTVGNHREVYNIDLSTLDGLTYADMVVQANDYIYIEPTKQISKEVLKEITPIVSILSGTIAIIALIHNIK